ncbi:MAG: TrkA family potassium uptake protein [Eubacteriales bacterium]|nr:TrkA family potassium uptake protein [Eubacteriales bacterium]
MVEKKCAVIGLGLFGMAVAQTLAEANCEVLVVDNEEEKLQEVVDFATYAICADVTEPKAWKAIDLENIDVVIIAISENMEASIIAAMNVLEQNVPYVIAKAISKIHGRVLEKLGVNEVIYPEMEMGKRVARNLTNTGVAEVFEISDTFSMIDVEIPKAWGGKTLQELKIRDKYHVNVVAVCETDKVDVGYNPMQGLPEKCKLILVGNNTDLEKVISLPK